MQIFPYVNSIVVLIFNEKLDEKWNLWVCKQYMNVLFTMEKSTNVGWTKKKKKREKTAEQKLRRHNNLNPNGHIVYSIPIIII